MTTSRNPRNTAVFILAVYDQPAQPEYQDNLAKTIKSVQALGFEPYIVSPHDELLIESNLFIKLEAPCVPVEMTKPYWREFNFILMDNVVFDDANLKEMFDAPDLPRLFTTIRLCMVGIGFENDGTDWTGWIRNIKSETLHVVPTMLLSMSKKMKFPCPNTTP
jgi:hypothetical protein